MPSCRLTVIISTYNWPDALKTVLLALDKNQDDAFEVIVADDGSHDITQSEIASIKEKVHYPLHHVWQEDNGFRVARIRNIAIQEARGDYIVFIDQDTIPRKDFITQHRLLAESGYFVSGSRVYFNDNMTKRVLTDMIDITDFSFWWYVKAKLKKHCNRCLPMLRLRLPAWIRKHKKRQWKGTANLLGVWRADLLAVNGYDEQFMGWGYEDSDLVCRLLAHGVNRKLGKFATEVVHLHHPIRSRDTTNNNYAMLQETLQGERPLFSQEGITNHISRTYEKPDLFVTQ